MMESLLSLAFDNLSSYDGPKVRKGLRQVEGLLAQICLSNPRNDRTKGGRDPDKDDSEASPSRNKDLAQLGQDPAFREFFKLQEGFEWNVAMRLIGTLDRLMAKGSDGQNDLLILSALDLIQGALLLHPPSKSLFSREQNMNVRIDLGLPLYYPIQLDSIDSLTDIPFIASPRPPRALQLSSDPIRNPPNSRHGPYRHSPKHTHLRGPRRPPHCHLSLQVALYRPRG